MKKLLHERLRDWVNESEQSGYLPTVVAHYDLEFDNGSICDKQRELFNYFVDEIERYYIPRPRFEDGEPVQFGDKVEGLPGCVYSFELFGDGSGRVIDFCNNDVNIDEEPFYLKRPQPKVLDADGVEIKVGDTVYEIKNGHKSKVTSTTMIDGDGNTICCVDGCPGHICYKPNELTHKEPDSLEKLRDDMTNYYSPSISDEDNIAMCDWVNRLTALIEEVDE